MEIQIKYFSDAIDKLAPIGDKSDWIDLRAAADFDLKAGEYALIPIFYAVFFP